MDEWNKNTLAHKYMNAYAVAKIQYNHSTFTNNVKLQEFRQALLWM